MAQGKAQKRYAQLEHLRDPFLRRARAASKLTLPGLVPPEGQKNGSRNFPTPYQSIGSRGVNNLANKLLLALLPPNTPFFRMSVRPADLKLLEEEPEKKDRIESDLSDYERSAMREVEASGDRVPVFEALKHLIVAGNILIYKGKDGLRVWHLDSYVVSRDPMGNVLEIITREAVSPSVFAKYERFKAALDDATAKNKTMAGEDPTVEIYTHVFINDDNMWEVYQETNGLVIPKSRGTFPLTDNPYIPLRFTRIDGESYGRGHVEEYYGDLKSLESLTRSIVEGAAASAKVNFFVNPNGNTKKAALARAENGDILSGNAADVSVLRVDKMGDFRVARETMQEISTRLSFAFLLNSTVQRDAERVTAEEIRYVAGELEDALGGLYSLLAQEFQLPYIRLVLKVSKLPKLPKGVVEPVIITGIEALGRGHDLRKLETFVGNVIQVFGPQVVSQFINPSVYLERAAAAVGVDSSGLVKTAEEVAQEQSAAQQGELAKTLAPSLIKEGGAIAQQGME